MVSGSCVGLAQALAAGAGLELRGFEFQHQAGGGLVLRGQTAAKFFAQAPEFGFQPGEIAQICRKMWFRR